MFQELLSKISDDDDEWVVLIGMSMFMCVNLFIYKGVCICMYVCIG